MARLALAPRELRYTETVKLKSVEGDPPVMLVGEGKQLSLSCNGVAS